VTSDHGSRSFARYAACVLAYNVVVVLWGAYVRATGSGAGCGNHWPLCNGVVVPQAPAITTIIEFTHRASSGIDVVLVGILLWWAWRAFPRGHSVRLGAVLSAVFLTTEALIGAALVKLEHVAHNASAGRAYSLSAHLINTLTLLACLTLTLWWASGGSRLRIRQRAGWLAAPGIALAVLVGISGAIAALGDTLFPASSLAAGFQQDFDPASSIFLRLRLLHPMLALITGGWLVFYAEATRLRLPPAARFARVLEIAVGLQIAAGATNLFLLAPVWMQMVHLLLADTVWIALILLVAFALQDSLAGADRQFDELGEMAADRSGLERAGAKRP
jgi:heme a synthase